MPTQKGPQTWLRYGGLFYISGVIGSEALTLLVSLKTAAKLAQNLMSRLNFSHVHPLSKLVNPWSLKTHCAIERLFSSVCKHNKLCPEMVRIRLKLQQAILHEIIDDSLYVLTIGPHISGDP